MIESFVLYTRHLKHLDKLTDSQAGQLLKALYSYSIGEERAEMDVATELLFGIITEQMDYDRQKWEETKSARRNAGLKSAEARANKKEQSSTKSNKVEQDPTNSTVSVSVSVSDSVSVSNKESDREKNKSNKTDDTRIEFQYGTWMNVILTTDEYVKLGKEMGNRDRDYYIDRLSDYLKNNPKKTYASHYRTLLNWKRGDEHKAELKVIASNGTAAEKRTDSDLYARAMKMGAVTQ